MPSIASIGTVTAGAPRIEVGLLKTESPVLPTPLTHEVFPDPPKLSLAAVPSKTTAGTIGYPIADGAAGRRQHHPHGC